MFPGTWHHGLAEQHHSGYRVGRLWMWLDVHERNKFNVTGVWVCKIIDFMLTLRILTDFIRTRTFLMKHCNGLQFRISLDLYWAWVWTLYTSSCFLYLNLSSMMLSKELFIRWRFWVAVHAMSWATWFCAGNAETKSRAWSDLECHAVGFAGEDD